MNKVNGKEILCTSVRFISEIVDWIYMKSATGISIKQMECIQFLYVSVKRKPFAYVAKIHVININRKGLYQNQYLHSCSMEVTVII